VSDQDQDPESHDEVLPNAAADEFFGRMKHDFRRPKPSEEAIASALQAIQKLTGEFPVEHSFKPPSQAAEEKCPKCGAENSASNRFCGYCGSLMHRPEEHVTEKKDDASSPGQHIYHHHYHHHIFSDSSQSSNESTEGFRSSAQAKPAQSDSAVEQSPTPEDQAESADVVQKLIQKWSRCFNTQRMDELLDLYSSDSIVLRPNSAPAHGKDAVRKILEAAVNSGVADVQLDCADIGIVGDFACLTGHSKMLFPTAPAKRQEAAGKYLIVVRRESGQWKIVADSWCMDSPKVPAASTGNAVLSARGQRKST
jgi:uncharacterized protein (TIGR02246 family)